MIDGLRDFRATETVVATFVEGSKRLDMWHKHLGPPNPFHMFRLMVIM